jgi:hypothetical protein
MGRRFLRTNHPSETGPMLTLQIKLLLLVLVAGAGRRPRWVDGLAPQVERACLSTSAAAPSPSVPVRGARSLVSEEDGRDGVPSSSPRPERIGAMPTQALALRRLS